MSSFTVTSAFTVIMSSLDTSAVVVRCTEADAGDCLTKCSNEHTVPRVLIFATPSSTSVEDILQANCAWRNTVKGTIALIHRMGATWALIRCGERGYGRETAGRLRWLGHQLRRSRLTGAVWTSPHGRLCAARMKPRSVVWTSGSQRRSIAPPVPRRSTDPEMLSTKSNPKLAW